MDLDNMLGSNESSLELEQEQPKDVVTSVASSSTISSSSSSSSVSSTSSTSSVDLDIIAKPRSLIPIPVEYDGNQLAAGPDEATKHFPSRNPSAATSTVAVVAAAPPAQTAHGPLGPFDPYPKFKFDTAPRRGDIPVPDYHNQPSSRPTAVEDTSIDGLDKSFSDHEREVAAADPILGPVIGALFGKAQDEEEEENKDIYDDSNISVPQLNDSNEFYEPDSNNTSNTSVSINEGQEVKADNTATKRATRSLKSLGPDTLAGDLDVPGTRTSSRLKATTSSHRGSSKFGEGHLFSTLKEFLEQVSPKLRENNHHVKIHVQENFSQHAQLSLLSASMYCANEKGSIGCGCTAIAKEILDEEYEEKMGNRKSYKPRFLWQITRYQPEPCMACMESVAALSEDQIQQNHQAWLEDKAVRSPPRQFNEMLRQLATQFYQNGNKVSEMSDSEEDDDDAEGTSRRRSSKGLARKIKSRNYRVKAPASARRDSPRHPSISRASSRNENEEGGSDMDIGDNEQENRSDAESDASDDVITVSASFNGSRLDQVKKEGTSYAESVRSASSQPREKVYKETKPLGPIPGHEHRNSARKKKSKTSTGAFYGTSPAASSSKPKKQEPPPHVLRNHAKQGVRDQRAKSAAASTRHVSASTIGLRKRSHEESETTDTSEPPEEVPYRQERFPRIGSFGLMSPGPLPPPHLSQAPRLSASPAKRFKSNRGTSSPKMKFSAKTPISSFRLLPIALEVVEKAEIKTLGDFSDNGTSSSDLFRWFLTYYCLTKFGIDVCSGSKDGDVRGELVKGAETMQFLAASRLLGNALDQLEQEEEH